ncbi:Uncharacterised protein [Burkholderia pseudomallei]|uniref:hypothetical protein n=1 Tax=Burkholderia pseudomallei TaxID=28450 RepID=UPI000F08B36F|nr:hypothetical protein [Burkholderia pseudomallei]VBT21780.1 Uncharacterised protein [Burkholderia pseudomallei]
MLELTQQQWAALCAVDERNFVATVRDDIVQANPKLRDDSTLLERLVNAYEAAKALGLRQDKSLGDFLYIEAEAPNFYRKSAIANWLSKPVGTADTRFDDLLAVLRKNLKEREESR